MRGLLAAALVWAGCAGSGQTSVLVTIEAPAGAVVRALDVSISTSGASRASRSLSDPELPGKLLVVLEPAALDVMLSLSARDATGQTLSAGANVASQPREQVAITMVLAYGGQPDGGTGDQGARDGGSGCNVALCEDFEAPTLDPRWFSSGNVSLDTTVAHRGSRSLKLHVDALTPLASGGAFIRDTALLPAIGNTVWVRAFFRVSALPVGGDNMQILALEQATGNIDGDYLFLRGNGASIYSQFANQSANGNPGVQTNVWFCAIWQVVLATTATGSMAMSGDLPARSLSNLATQGTPAVTRLELGPWFSSTATGQLAMDVWLDDLLVDASPLDCQR